MIKFNKKEAREWVLCHNWSLGKWPIMFKKWNPLLDAQRENIKESLVLVKFPGFSFPFWMEPMFRAIGDSLGQFLELESYSAFHG